MIRRFLTWLAGQFAHKISGAMMSGPPDDDESDPPTAPVICLSERAKEMRLAAYRHRQNLRNTPKEEPKGPRPGSKEWRVQERKKVL